MSQTQAILPPYPSFSLVMASMETYPLRLPAYRSSYLNRHHPYPRVKRPLDLMRTVDRRFDDDELEESPMYSRQPITRNDSEDGTDLLHAALHPAASLGDGSDDPKRTSFTSLVIDLSLAVRRGCRRVLAATGTQKGAVTVDSSS